MFRKSWGFVWACKDPGLWVDRTMKVHDLSNAFYQRSSAFKPFKERYGCYCPLLKRLIHPIQEMKTCASLKRQCTQDYGGVLYDVPGHPLANDCTCEATMTSLMKGNTIDVDAAKECALQTQAKKIKDPVQRAEYIKTARLTQKITDLALKHYRDHGLASQTLPPDVVPLVHEAFEKKLPQDFVQNTWAATKALLVKDQLVSWFQHNPRGSWNDLRQSNLAGVVAPTSMKEFAGKIRISLLKKEYVKKRMQVGFLSPVVDQKGQEILEKLMHEMRILIFDLKETHNDFGFNFDESEFLTWQSDVAALVAASKQEWRNKHQATLGEPGSTQWMKTILYAVPNTVEALWMITAGNLVQEFADANAGAWFINATRKVANKMPLLTGGSILGTDEEFAHRELWKSALALNPLGQAGQVLSGTLEGIRMGYMAYASAASGLTLKQYHQAIEKGDNSYLTGGLYSFKASKALFALASFLGTGRTSGWTQQTHAALQTTGVVVGYASITSLGNELILAGEKGHEFNFGRLVEGIYNSGTDSLATIGLLGVGASQAGKWRASPKVAIKKGDPHVIATLNASQKLAVNLSEIADLAEAMAPEQLVQVVDNFGNAETKGQWIGSFLVAGGMVLDMHDAALSGMAKALYSYVAHKLGRSVSNAAIEEEVKSYDQDALIKIILEAQEAMGSLRNIQQIETIVRVHLETHGEEGPNGKPAGAGNLSLGQLRRKYEMLINAKDHETQENLFTKEEVRALIRRSVVGSQDTPDLKELLANPTRRNAFRLSAEDAHLLRKAFNITNDFEREAEEIREAYPEIAHLRDEELFAIVHYSESDGYAWNFDLITGAHKLSDEDQVQARALLSALLNMPHHEGEVYRWVREDHYLKIENYPVGQIIQQDFFISTSLTNDRNNVSDGQLEPQTKFVIQSKTGKNISFLSSNPYESEVLFAAGTKFRVSKVDQFNDSSIYHENGEAVPSIRQVIYLEEVNPNTPVTFSSKPSEPSSEQAETSVEDSEDYELLDEFTILEYLKQNDPDEYWRIEALSEAALDRYMESARPFYSQQIHREREEALTIKPDLTGLGLLKDRPNSAGRPRDEVIESWDPSRFSDPRLHQDDNFMYIVSSVGDYIDFVTDDGKPLPPDLIQLVQESVTRKYDPTKIHERHIISASVVSDRHMRTYQGWGYILKVPKENIMAVYPSDLKFDSYAALVSREQGMELARQWGEASQFVTPEKLLEQTRDPGEWDVDASDFYNEILIAGTSDSGSQVEVVGIFDSAGTTYYMESSQSRQLERQAEAIAKEQGIPILQLSENDEKLAAVFQEIDFYVDDQIEEGAPALLPTRNMENLSDEAIAILELMEDSHLSVQNYLGWRDELNPEIRRHTDAIYDPKTKNVPKKVMTSSKPRHFGMLTSTGESDGSTGGVWHEDLNGTRWFVKEDDVLHPELQSAAEVISSAIYRELGYHAPYTYIDQTSQTRRVIIESLGEDLNESLLRHLDTPEFRQLRVVAAYLKDWDRLEEGPNNVNQGHGTFSIFDFGGTLGAGAMGGPKPGLIFSNAIGTFEPFDTFQKIWDDFQPQLPSHHAWNRVTREDKIAVAEKLNELTDDKIRAIVEEAQYSRAEDTQYMIEALIARRDAIINEFSTTEQKEGP